MIYSFKKTNYFTYLYFLHFFEFMTLAEVLPLVILFSGILWDSKFLSLSQSEIIWSII